MTRVTWAVAGLVCATATTALGWFQTGRPTPTPGGVIGWVGGCFSAGAQIVVEWGTTHPGWVALVACAVLWRVLAWFARQPRLTSLVRDPVRMFTSEQRRAGFDRCQRRCEFDGWLPWLRCAGRVEHADHWFPWSKGGATSPANLVGACRWHNLSKSAAWPTRAQTGRIAARRAKYWTGPDAERTPGAFYGQNR